MLIELEKYIVSCNLLLYLRLTNVLISLSDVLRDLR